MKQLIILSLWLLFFTACQSSYHYSSQPDKIKTKVQTDIQSIQLLRLNGINIQREDKRDLKVYLRNELLTRTHIRLDKNSENRLSIDTIISPIRTKKYKDKFLGKDNYHVEKHVSLTAHYKVTNNSGKTIASETYMYDHNPSTVSGYSYREAEEKHSIGKIRQKLMKRLAKSIVGQIIEEKKIQNKK